MCFVCIYHFLFYHIYIGVYVCIYLFIYWDNRREAKNKKKSKTISSFATEHSCCPKPVIRIYSNRSKSYVMLGHPHPTHKKTTAAAAAEAVATRQSQHQQRQQQQQQLPTDNTNNFTRASNRKPLPTLILCLSSISSAVSATAGAPLPPLAVEPEREELLLPTPIARSTQRRAFSKKLSS